MRHSRSSRQRYKNFVDEYRAGTLDQRVDAEKEGVGPKREPGKRREYLKDYLKWLWPHRWATGRPTIERAKCADDVADISVINIAVDDVGNDITGIFSLTDLVCR